ncbi:hypothetical protein EYC80_007751 [Monilinia laxa]|uniref:Uncharacterized protein n=1 Tax=Monilinia laxa TaxID=61186 RepID=A0A5N6JWX5_MONLA|nr:hypothetical protein EYC80_007751 [Monilinia laxa]
MPTSEIRHTTQKSNLTVSQQRSIIPPSSAQNTPSHPKPSHTYGPMHTHSQQPIPTRMRSAPTRLLHHQVTCRGFQAVEILGEDSHIEAGGVKFADCVDGVAG